MGGLFADMEERARALLAGADEFGDKIVISRSADMRYVGQGYEIEVPLPDVAFGPGAVEAIRDRFLAAYASTFGRTIADGRPEVISWRMTATLPGSHIDLAYRPASGEAVRGTRRVHFERHGDLETTLTTATRYPRNGDRGSRRRRGAGDVLRLRTGGAHHRRRATTPGRQARLTARRMALGYDQPIYHVP
ncbi:hypothetical protein [Actinomadura welshii]|uniref:hypothetical protein n=1 Tax=Actinomadura welshii TaxID=3103817 RepID=UPI0003AD0006|nr:hypothetical protein [Actinomadura madurae]